MELDSVSSSRPIFRKVQIPANRLEPLAEAWMEIYPLIVEQMKIAVSVIPNWLVVELKTTPNTPDVGNLDKCANFLRAFMLGFNVADASNLVRTDELLFSSFGINLTGDELSRAIERLDSKGLAIENASKTSIARKGSKFHILGLVTNIRLARDLSARVFMGQKVRAVDGSSPEELVDRFAAIEM